MQVVLTCGNSAGIPQTEVVIEVGHDQPLPEREKKVCFVRIAMIVSRIPAVADMGSVAKLVEQGLFKREYRDHRLEWMIRSGGMQVVADGMARNTIRFTPDLR